MNFLQRIFALVVLVSILQPVAAKDVAREIARTAAFNYLSNNGLIKDHDAVNSNFLSEVTTVESDGLPAIYVFSPGGESFILVAADDAMMPVLGYSFESSFPAPGTNLNFDSFLHSFVDQIKWVRANNVQTSRQIGHAWDKCLALTDAAPHEVLTVGPYLRSSWNQNNPYNEFCPADSKGPGGKVYAGCVATAMSQIMYHYRYPSSGKGKHGYVAGSYGIQSVDFSTVTYNWDAMQSQIGMISGDGIPANALLQYHAGVSVDMDYSFDGSGAFSADAITALRENFKYSSLMQYLEKNNYSTSTWEGMLLEELDMLKPVYYGGHSTEVGHAFVCDGYQQTDSDLKFHFNFGWSGSGNGYYTSVDANGFKSSQVMIRNIVPASNYPPGCGTKQLTYARGSFEDGSGPRDSYGSNLDCSWLITPTDSVKLITLSFKRFEVDPSDTLFIYDGPDASYPQLKALTGDSVTGEIKSTGSTMFVRFVTSSNNEANGWLAEYSASSPAFCSGINILYEPVGTISDGSGDRNYMNNANCQFKIQPPDARDLTLTFSEFDLEPKDVVSIFLNGTSTLLAEYTGSDIPAPVSVPTGGLFVRFRTDAYYTKGGFKASYSTSNVSNAKFEHLSSISLYPNPADDFVTLRAISDKTQKLKLSLSDIAGKSLLYEEFTASSPTIEYPVDINKLKPGIYFLTIRNDAGNSTTQKIVVR